MPITVTCRCGKIWSVRDDLAGATVTCRICGAVVRVDSGNDDLLIEETLTAAPARAATSARPQPPLAVGAETVAQPGQERYTCPYCAEVIPARSKQCPMCGEALPRSLSSEMRCERLKAIMDSTDRAISDPAQSDADAAIKGRTMSGGTWAALAVALLGAAAVAGVTIVGDRDSEASALVLLLGLASGIIASLYFLVLVSRDVAAWRISASGDARLAAKRYFDALIHGRAAKAYVAVAPAGRAVDEVAPVQPANLPPWKGPGAIADFKSYRRYWREVVGGPRGYRRSVALKNVTPAFEDAQDLAMVEVTLSITSVNSWALLALLGGLLPGLIILLALQKRAEVKVRKLLVRRGGRWFVAEAELEGPLDTVGV